MMPTSLQLAGDIAGSPLSFVVVTLISAVPLLIYKLHPEWRERKRKASIDVFERLCSAYRAHKSDPSDDISRARLSFCAEEYCRTPVNYRLADMAFRSENAVRVFNTIRKLPNEITFENGYFRKTLRPYSFPSDKAERKRRMLALSVYLIFCSMFGGSYILRISDILTLPEMVAIMIFSSLPFLIFVALAKSAIRLKRLIEIHNLIKSKMPECIDKNS